MVEKLNSNKYFQIITGQNLDTYGSINVIILDA